MGQSEVSRKRRPFCTSCCRPRDCLGVRKKIRGGNSKRNRSWCAEEVGKIGDNLPQHSMTTIMRANLKKAKFQPERRRPDRGSEKPYETGLAYLLVWTHCGIRASRRFSNSRILLMVKSPVDCKAVLVKIILD